MHRTAADLSFALLRTYEFYTEAAAAGVVRTQSALSRRRRTRHCDERVRRRTEPRRRHADPHRRVPAHRAARGGEAEPAAAERSVGGVQRTRSVDAADHHRRARGRHVVRRRSRRRCAAELPRTRQPYRRGSCAASAPTCWCTNSKPISPKWPRTFRCRITSVSICCAIWPHAWGVMKKRSFRRSRSTGPMKICVGLRDVALLHLRRRRVRRPTGHHRGAAAPRDQSVHAGTGGATPQRAPGDVWDNAFDLQGRRSR